MNLIKCYNPKWPRERYTDMPPELYMIPHQGQRKLLIAEIAFITKYRNLSDTVVYAGAGPGAHIVELAQLFPTKMFHLYDPREFARELHDQPNVQMVQDYFTDECAKRHSDGVLFISDIRTGSDNGGDFEKEVVFNLDQQQQWCELMKPCMASLKFRLPFESENMKFKYYAGQIRLQAWVGRASTETRLWTNCKELIEYDRVEYEEHMFHFNKNLRLGPFNNPMIKCVGMDSCNDCAIEWHTWNKYHKYIGSKIEDRDICDYVQSAPQKLALGPHGKLPNDPDRITLLAEEAKKFYNQYKKAENNRKELNDTTYRKKDKK